MTLRGWSLLLGVAGLLISLYLTIVHYAEGQVTLVCPNVGFINCEEVTSSAESMLGSVPVALMGVIFFGISVLGELLRRTRLQLAWTAVGLLFVFYLVYAQMFVIGALCMWCTAVHVLTAALFLIAVVEWTAEPVRSLPATNGRTSRRRPPASGH